MRDSLEHDLRRALKRVEPPAGFADRVMTRLPERRFGSRWLVGAVAAGLAIISTVGGIEHHRHERRVEAERTERQVAFALSLASEKLDHAMNRVNVRLRRSAPDITIGGGERGRL